jgi:hypothetical protein
MKKFLHLSGAAAIGSIFALAFTFPTIIIGAVIGYFFIAEYLEYDED